MKLATFLLAFSAFVAVHAYVDYTGHKVITVFPRAESHIKLLLNLRNDYNVDLWNEPRDLGSPVMTHLRPEMIESVENLLKEKHIEYEVAYHNLQSAIEEERRQHAPTPNASQATDFDFGKYHQYHEIENLIKNLGNNYPKIATLEIAGKSYENRAIYLLKISSGDSSNKPAIAMDCGIHAREWSSVAACAYLVNRLITTYDTDSEVKSLVDKYEFNVIVESNPDGYIFTWSQDRLWRKTRSRSALDWLGVCLGVDANRNFDIEHCGVGTSRKPCEEIYCGDKPFSESEARAIRDLMIAKKNRLAIYFSVHAYSQFWMTPYGINKKLPENYNELVRVGRAGVDALAKKYGTQYKLGSIANIIYEAAGSSVDYAYVKLGIKLPYALELRDNGRFGFILPQKDVLPMCEETYDGIIGAIKAL